MTISRSNIDILLEMIKTDFKLRYHGSILGFIWVLLKPLIMFSILYLVFSFFFAKGDTFFSLRLILGLTIFSFFSEGTTHGIYSLFNKANIILKVNFPRQIVIFASVVNSLITLFLSLVIFVVFWAFNPTTITWYWLLFPVYLLILTMIVTGFSFFASIMFIRTRDLGNIWELLLQVLFYLSAIFYPITLLPQKLQTFFFLNPVSVIIHQSRQVLIDNQVPDYKFLGGAVLVGVVLLITGYRYFNKNIKAIAEYF